MKRRGFLKLLASAPVVAAVPVKIPVAVAPVVQVSVAPPVAVGALSGGLLMPALWSKKLLEHFYSASQFDRAADESQRGISNLHRGTDSVRIGRGGRT